MATYTRTWHWNCASSLCTNNYRTKGITYYTLPSDPELQKGYRKVLMNENINWRKHVICSAHWSSGKRERTRINCQTLEGQTFSYEALMRYPNRIYYMTGLSLSELDCLYECLEPFLHTIVYPDCNNDDSSHLRKLNTKTELIRFLTICRNALDLGVNYCMDDWFKFINYD